MPIEGNLKGSNQVTWKVMRQDTLPHPLAWRKAYAGLAYVRRDVHERKLGNFPHPSVKFPWLSILVSEIYNFVTG
jgi:hypothetical protein